MVLDNTNLAFNQVSQLKYFDTFVGVKFHYEHGILSSCDIAAKGGFITGIELSEVELFVNRHNKLIESKKMRLPNEVQS